MSSTKVHHGGCHCGKVKYQIRLTFPPINKAGAESIRIYKCNCTLCQKMAFFHVRPISITDDFVLTSPSTIEELGDYRTNTGKIGWYYCKDCGCRTFAMGGEWSEEEVDADEWAGRERGSGELQRVWKSRGRNMIIKTDGKDENKFYHYLSVNAVTLEPGDVVDLREWHEKGWVFYVENRLKSGGTSIRFGEPHFGGCY